MAESGTIMAFGGMAPRVNPAQLQPNQAQLAYNARLTSGALEPLNGPLLLASLSGLSAPAKSLFKSVSNAGARWLAWPKHVDAVRALVAGDRKGTVYYTGDGPPKFTNYELAGRDGYPMAAYMLGLPAPTAAATVSHTGSTGDVINRAFLYAFANADGTQESQASPAVTAAGRVAGTWSVSGLQAPPANSYSVSSAVWAAGVLTVTSPDTFGLRVGDLLDHGTLGQVEVTSVTTTQFTVAFAADPTPLTGGFARSVPYDVTGAKWRIYWSELDGSYKLMGEWPVSTTLPITINAAAVGSAVEPLLDAPMPPIDLKSLCRHSSGALFGISGNELCASAPYKPYAWPNAYRTPLASDPVACRTSGAVVVVGTAGTPEVFIGADPSTMQPEDVKSVWPCLSSRAMVSYPNGVAFPTRFGLAWLGAGAPTIITDASYVERDWRELNPASFFAASYGVAYVAAYESPTGTEFWFFRPNEPAPVSLGSAADVTALYTDPQDGSLIMAKGDQVYRFDADTGVRLTYTWTSKLFQTAAPVNYGAYKVFVDFNMTPSERAAAEAARQAVLTANAALMASGSTKGELGGAPLGTYMLGGSALSPVPDATFDRLGITLIAAGEILYSERVTDNRMQRLPSGYKSDTSTFVISGNVPVTRFEFAETGEGLRAQ